MKTYLLVTNVETGKEKRGFRSWKEMARWMQEQFDNGVERTALLPCCNGCNLFYWLEEYKTMEEYLHYVINYAIGLQLLG